MALTLEEFKDRLGKQCDPEVFIDVLEIDIDRLMDAFEFDILNNMSKFEDLFDIYAEEFDTNDR